MSQADQLGPVTSDARAPVITEKRYFDWPILMVGLALICTFAWNCALLWGAVCIYLTIFS
jgi:hypothetical protein